MVFLAGKTGFTFLHGQVSSTGKFLPGAEVDEIFTPGVLCDNGFVEGRFVKAKKAKGPTFAPGKHSPGGKFEKALDEKDVVVVEPPPLGTGTCKVVDGSSLSVVFKKTKPKNGVMITTKTGSHRFIPDGQVTLYKPFCGCDETA